ncbi:hypothetical protein D3C73_1097310 [compost metagenome]
MADGLEEFRHHRTRQNGAAADRLHEQERHIQQHTGLAEQQAEHTGELDSAEELKRVQQPHFYECVRSIAVNRKVNGHADQRSDECQQRIDPLQ